MAPQLFGEITRLSPSDRPAWNAALGTYEKLYARRDLLFDDQLASYYESLTKLADSGAGSLRRAALPKPLESALTIAAPIYSRTYWAADNAGNERWMTEMKPLLARFGAPLAARLAATFATPWRTVPYRDDVVRYSSWQEAYTLDERPAVFSVIGSATPDNAGRAALETIFHEASHSLVFPDYGPVADAINGAAKRDRRPAPDQLWHAVIFYTVGRFTEKLYSGVSERPYHMFADTAGLWRDDWSKYRTALAKHWEPYLNGHGTMSAALANCVRDILV